MANSTEFITYNIEVNTKTGQVNIEGITKGFEDANKSFNKLKANVSKGVGDLNKELGGTSKASGGATASVMELSRVISDAPYGIRGMANNLTQLVSQIGFTAKSAGGLGKAFGLMVKQLTGPLGIVFAITAAISVIDMFFGAQKKAEEAAEDTTSALERQKKELIELTEKYEEHIKVKESVIQATTKEREMLKALVAETLDLSNSEERRKRTLEKLIKLYPKYFSGLNIDNLKGIKDAEKDVNRILQNKLKLKKALERAEEIANEIQLEKLKIANAANVTEKKEAVRRIGELREQQEGVRELIQVYAGLDLTLKDDEKDPLSPFKDPETFQKDAEDYLRQIRAVQKKIAMLGEKDAASKLIMQRYFHLEELKQKHKQNLEKFEQETKAARASLKIELDKQLALKNITKSYHKTALADFDKNASDERQKTQRGYEILLAYHKNYYEKAIQIKEDAIIQSAEIDERSPSVIGGASPEQIAERQREIFAMQLESYMQFQQGMTDFMNGEFDRQLTVEQNKTNALNNELRERLNNENLSQEERKRIQLKIARNDEALRKKQEKIERKRFNFQKAANISQALISTYLAAAQVQANPAFADPLSKKIAMILTITTGLLNVAKISRQKFQSSAGATSTAGSLGSGDGGRGSRSFNFNLAGSTGENQLAQTLQGRFDQPLQAYVVSRDITNAQQLQEDIQNNASFG